MPTKLELTTKSAAQESVPRTSTSAESPAPHLRTPWWSCLLAAKEDAASEAPPTSLLAAKAQKQEAVPSKLKLTTMVPQEVA